MLRTYYVAFHLEKDKDLVRDLVTLRYDFVDSHDYGITEGNGDTEVKLDKQVLAFANKAIALCRPNLQALKRKLEAAAGDIVNKDPAITDPSFLESIGDAKLKAAVERAVLNVTKTLLELAVNNQEHMTSDDTREVVSKQTFNEKLCNEFLTATLPNGTRPENATDEQKEAAAKYAEDTLAEILKDAATQLQLLEQRFPSATQSAAAAASATPAAAAAAASSGPQTTTVVPHESPSAPRPESEAGTATDVAIELSLRSGTVSLTSEGREITVSFCSEPAVPREHALLEIANRAIKNYMLFCDKNLVTLTDDFEQEVYLSITNTKKAAPYFLTKEARPELKEILRSALLTVTKKMLNDICEAGSTSTSGAERTIIASVREDLAQLEREFPSVAQAAAASAAAAAASATPAATEPSLPARALYSFLGAVGLARRRAAPTHETTTTEPADDQQLATLNRLEAEDKKPKCK